MDITEMFFVQQVIFAIFIRKSRKNDDRIWSKVRKSPESPGRESDAGENWPCT